MSEIVLKIAALFLQRGEEAYFGEAVTQAAHALQCAQLATDEGAAPELIAAALLHDIGHLFDPEDIADQGIDGLHEEQGARWLEAHFPPSVTEPVRLHVPAKRYLCAVEPGYLAGLSPASVKSLALQGGPFTPDEVAAFESNPHFAAAVRLRRWDDTAKVVGLAVAPIETYLPLLEQAQCKA